MKKLLLTLLLPLSIISSASYEEELNSLFGVALYDNAEKYVSSNYINSNKLSMSQFEERLFNCMYKSLDAFLIASIDNELAS